MRRCWLGDLPLDGRPGPPTRPERGSYVINKAGLTLLSSYPAATRGDVETVTGYRRPQPASAKADPEHSEAPAFFEQAVVQRPRPSSELAGDQAAQAVFITTGRFSTGAREYADAVPTRIVLIDRHA